MLIHENTKINNIHKIVYNHIYKTIDFFCQIDYNIKVVKFKKRGRID